MEPLTRTSTHDRSRIFNKRRERREWDTWKGTWTWEATWDADLYKLRGTMTNDKGRGIQSETLDAGLCWSSDIEYGCDADMRYGRGEVFVVSSKAKTTQEGVVTSKRIRVVTSKRTTK